MNWLNIEMRVLRAPEYIGSEPVQRATWLQLLAYCAEQENSGVIRDSAVWKDRRWQQTCGVTLQEVMQPCDLWTWKGNHLHVWSYPHSKQQEVQAKRTAGHKGGKESGKSRTRPSTNEAHRETQLQAELEATNEAQLQTPHEAELERKGKEGEGERNIKEAEEEAAAAASDSLPKITPEMLRDAYPRKTHLADTLREAAACMRRHDPQKILDGTRAIAAAVARWTESERMTYLKKPSEFFAGDHWADDPAHWRGRHDRATTPTQEELPSLGGRKPASHILI